MKSFAFVSAVLACAGAASGQFTFSVIAEGLSAPTGIAVRGANQIYFTEVPTPGVPGSQGGMNAVKVMNAANGKVQTISSGEPEPINIALDQRGRPYWTCRSAGVILTVDNRGTIAPLLMNLDMPTGIDIGKDGYVYFTQVPSPGVPMGPNTTNRTNGVMVETLTMGEPEPYDIAVSSTGTTYWTCKSAGVILMRTSAGMVSPVLTNLSEPTGIALDEERNTLYFTEVPTPGLPGSMGGMNTVNAVDLATNTRTVLHTGDPEPTDIAVAANGNIFWTCTSAGVIVRGKRTE